MHSAIVSAKGVWWKKVHSQEKFWIKIAFSWCMCLFIMMPFWHFKGGQNPAGIRTYIKPKEFEFLVNKFVNSYKISTEKGYPIVNPPVGSDIYLLSRMWNWYPLLKLKKGSKYILHLSSIDVNHGFSLYPAKINLQLLPNYDYALTILPNSSGEFKILCNEFCGIGHHFMVGKIIVE